MSVQVLDSMTDASQWSALQPDQATPSAAISAVLSQVNDQNRLPVSRVAIRGTTQSLGHIVQRTLPPISLTDSEEIRFWVRSNRTADGSPAAPFFLRLRFASAALPFANPGNTWHRLLRLTGRLQWDFVSVRRADMPPALSGGITAIRFECLDDSASFECVFASIFAVNERVVQDAQEAIRTRLDNHVSIGGTPVPASSFSPDAPPPALPHIRVMLQTAEPALQRDPSPEIASDFTDTGFQMRPPRIPWHLFFEVDAYAADGKDRASLMDVILDQLGSSSRLVINGEEVPVELAPYGVPIAAGRMPLRYRVSVWKTQLATSVPARPVREILIETEEQRASR